MSHVTSYTYGAGSTGNPQLSSDLLTITTPNAQPGGPDAGDATVNVYDSLGRVTAQTDPMGYQTTFKYCVSAATGDCLDPATGTGLVAVSDPDGNKSVYSYQQGTLASQSTFSGSTLTSETDKQPDTTSGTLLDASSTDSDGNITSDSYNTVGNITQQITPAATGTATTTSAYATQDAATAGDANCTTTANASAACQADSPPAPVAPGGTITPPSAAPPVGTTYTLYDADGNELYSTTGVYEPGATSASYSQTTYQLYRGNTVTLNGTAISCVATPPSQSLPCAAINADGVVTQLGYDSAGNLTSTSTPDGNGSQAATTTYTFDADGEQTSITLPDGNVSGANAGNYTKVTAYNADGEKTSVSVADGTGATASGQQVDLARCYLQALAKGDKTKLMAVADNDPPVKITNADLMYSADARSGLATAIFTPSPVDSTFLLLEINYANGAREKTGMINMAAMGDSAGWRMTIGMEQSNSGPSPASEKLSDVFAIGLTLNGRNWIGLSLSSVVRG